MKNLLLFLPVTILLAACNSAPSAPEPTDPAITQLVGVVGSGTGTGTVELLDATNTGAVLSSASVAADGSFTLPLPSADQFASKMVAADRVLAQVGCTGTLSSSTADTSGFGFAELKATRSGTAMQVVTLTTDLNLLPPHLAFKGHAWVYTDKATRLTGDLDCTQLIKAPGALSQLTLSVDAQTRAGWNVLEISGRTAGANLPTTASASATVVKDFQGSHWRTVADIAKTITNLSMQSK